MKLYTQVAKDICVHTFTPGKPDSNVEYQFDPDKNTWAPAFEAWARRRPLSIWKPLASPYAQMFFHGMMHRSLKVPYLSKTTTYPDGELCELDVYGPAEDQGRTILFVCHGLGGSSQSYYCRKLATCAARRGITVVVHNRRGHVTQNRSTKKPYPLHYDREDMDTAVAFVKTLFPDNKKLVGVGFSTGANLIVKYVGDTCAEGTNPFHGVVSVSNGWHVARGVDALSKSKELADLVGVAYVKEIVLNHPHLRPMADMLSRCTSLKAADEGVMKHVYGQDFDMGAYYDSISCIHVLDKVRVPVLAIASRDDPFLAGQVDRVHMQAVLTNPKHVCCVTTSTGGHVGWLDGPKCKTKWLYCMILDFARGLRPRQEIKKV